MKTHKELIPNNVGTFEESDVPDGYHYELQLLNDIWQWILVVDNSDITAYEFNEDNASVPQYYFDGGVIKEEGLRMVDMRYLDGSWWI